MTIEQAKERISITALWGYFNLAGRPTKNCRSPFREDKHPSFSVAADGQMWFDHAENTGGDVVDFFGRVKGLSPLAQSREFVAFARAYLGEVEQKAPARERKPAQRSVSESEQVDLAGSALRRILDDSRAPSETECSELGKLRALHPGAFELAARLGTLRVATVCRQKSWILTDARKLCADARRFDGKLYPAFGDLGERKTHSPGGSQKDWPVGLLTERPEVNECRTIVLVEGSADYFAALALIALYGSGDVLPIAKLGAGGSLSTEARVLIGKRRVIIASHADENRVGRTAAGAWASLLERTGADVYLRPCIRANGKDLNDMAARFCNDEAKLTQLAHALLE